MIMINQLMRIIISSNFITFQVILDIAILFVFSLKPQRWIPSLFHSVFLNLSTVALWWLRCAVVRRYLGILLLFRVLFCLNLIISCIMISAIISIIITIIRLITLNIFKVSFIAIFLHIKAEWHYFMLNLWVFISKSFLLFDKKLFFVLFISSSFFHAHQLCFCTFNLLHQPSLWSLVL